MNKQTLAALIAGAEKWDRNALAKAPEKFQIYAYSCKLCELFTLKNGHCGGCPVNAVTGDGCEGTPWNRAEDALWEWSRADYPQERRNARARFRRAAKAEAKFLRSLIPAKGATA